MVENLQIDIASLALIIAMLAYLKNDVRLGIDLTPNTRILIGNQTSDETFIKLNIRSVGGQPTTLQNVIIFGYENKLSYIPYIRNKPSYSGEVPVLDQYTPPLPHFLGLGTIWQTRISQKNLESVIEEHALKYIRIGVYDSSSKQIRSKKLPAQKPFLAL
jgi:hypothetical protein